MEFCFTGISFSTENKNWWLHLLQFQFQRFCASRQFLWWISFLPPVQRLQKMAFYLICFVWKLKKKKKKEHIHLENENHEKCQDEILEACPLFLELLPPTHPFFLVSGIWSNFPTSEMSLPGRVLVWTTNKFKNAYVQTQSTCSNKSLNMHRGVEK